MNDAVTMGAIERIGDFDGRSQQEVRGERPALEPLRERLALEILHHQKVDLVVTADVVQGTDVRVIELRDCSGFLFEPAASIRVLRRQARQDLQGDDPPEAGIASAIDFAHPTRADRRQNLVGAKLQARLEMCNRAGKRQTRGRVDSESGRLLEKIAGPIVRGQQRFHVRTHRLVVARRDQKASAFLARTRERVGKQLLKSPPWLGEHGRVPAAESYRRLSESTPARVLRVLANAPRAGAWRARVRIRPRRREHGTARPSRSRRWRTASGSACGPSCSASSGGWLRGGTAAPGLPVAFASHTAPGCATRAGPRGPSTVKPAGFPAAMSRVSCSSACAAAARRRPAGGPVAEPLDDAGDPFAVEVLAGDDDDAAAAEVVGGGKNAAVPERHHRLVAGCDDRVEMLEPVGLPAQRRPERGDQPIARRSRSPRPRPA